LKVYPFKLEHVAEWALEKFNENFNLGPILCNKFLKDGMKYIKDELEDSDD